MCDALVQNETNVEHPGKFLGLGEGEHSVNAADSNVFAYGAFGVMHTADSR